MQNSPFPQKDYVSKPLSPTEAQKTIGRWWEGKQGSFISKNFLILTT